MTQRMRFAAAVIGVSMLSVAWSAGPPSAPGSATADGPSPRALANARALEQADAAFQRARESCLRHPSEAQAACLEEARQAHAQASVGAAGERLPAVQTQSSSVEATGAAPIAVDERTPGVPARPEGTPSTPAQPRK